MSEINLLLASWTSSSGLTNILAYDTDGRITGISVPGVEGLGYSYDTTNRYMDTDSTPYPESVYTIALKRDSAQGL
jgi:hypothetical protein